MEWSAFSDAIAAENVKSNVKVNTENFIDYSFIRFWRQLFDLLTKIEIIIYIKNITNIEPNELEGD